MRTKNLMLFILVMFMVLPCKALAESKHFLPGSLIIPMDSYYQPEAGGGVLEAYGLIYQLLNHQDEQCKSACGDNQSCTADCEHDISVYWIIDGEKTAIDASDLVIEVSEEFLDAREVAAVVRPFRIGTSFAFDETRGDNSRRISYRGSAFIIHLPELTTAAADYARSLINSSESEWSAVKVHEALVEFTANYHRKMQGTPPKIALMNDTEDRTGGNAAILESYLRLAGVCTDVYEVLTPNDIAGIAANGSTITSRLITGGFDFLWAPHWEGYKSYSTDQNGNDKPDVEDIVSQVKLFLENGKALLAECASIETFEYSENGRFLSNYGFAHNGGTNSAADIRYNDVASPYAQIGDFPFRPEGGHLHNWRPFQVGTDNAVDDKGKFINFNFDTLPPDFDTLPPETSSYNDTVTRYTIDTEGWDYYVGGHAFGNNDFGYVIYLGGHKYATCKDDKGKAPPKPNVHPMKFEFKRDISDEVLKLKVKYSIVGTEVDGETEVEEIELDGDFTDKKGGADIEIDFTSAKVKDKKLEGVQFRNLTSSVIDIDSIELSWRNGPDDQQIKKIEDKYTDVKHQDAATDQPLDLAIADRSFIIERDPVTVSGAAGCAQNDDCEWKNIAGVRYILNTLFDIKYQITDNETEPPDPSEDEGSDPPDTGEDEGSEPPDTGEDEGSEPPDPVEFVRSAPIVAHPWLYQGSFEYPGYFGHFRRYNVEDNSPVQAWDTAAGGIPDAGAGTPDTDTGIDDIDDRAVYTAQYEVYTDQYGQEQKTWEKIDFDSGNVDALMPEMGVTSQVEAIEVINRLRGKDGDGESDVWVERNHPASPAYRGNFGGIMHSAPAIVSSGANDTRFTGRQEIAYVGDLYGLLHAIDTSNGQEQWAYIPRNLLGKLKNDRAHPAADSTADYAAVDASPTVRDIFYDPDHADDDPDFNPSWHTILVCPQGAGGKTVFALDVTDPANWKVLWEIIDNAASYTAGETLPPGGGMGHAFRAALDKVLVTGTNPSTGETTYHTKWMVFVATSYAEKQDDHGGIHIYAFDLKTGERVWPPFSSTYTDLATNHLPAAVTTYDTDGDSFADRVYVGDMNGRMWELNASDGTSPYATEQSGDAVPLFNAGIGNPIAVSPAITRRNGRVILVFGTGGTDGATVPASGHFSIYAVDATHAGNLSPADIDRNFAGDYKAATTFMWEKPLAAGEKAWSSPTIAANTVFMAVSGGTLESDDPGSDTGGGRLIAVNLDNITSPVWGDPITIGKVRGSLFVSNQHIYLTTIDNRIIQVGGDSWVSGFGNRTVLKTWRQF
jgi:hypothetical protein